MAAVNESLDGEKTLHAGATSASIRETICFIPGLTCSVVGGYFLIVPSEGSAEFLGRSIELVNFHRLYLGQTLTIIGAIFLAAAIRPR